MKDIILKIGDIIEFKDATKYCVNHYEDGKELNKIFTKNLLPAIIKVERPIKHETIYQKPQEILNKEEKEYLSAVIKPFRDKLVYIRKNKYGRCEWIDIDLKDSGFTLPSFDIGTMYKGMEVDREYTLEELGL